MHRKQRTSVMKKSKTPYATSISPSITTQYFRKINLLVRKVASLVRTKVKPILIKYSSHVVTDYMIDDAFGLELANAFADIEAEFRLLDKYALKIATSSLDQANKYHHQKFITSFKKTVGIDVKPLLSRSIKINGRNIDKGTYSTVQDAINNNVALIKTVPEQHLAKIQEMLYRGLATGTDNQSLYEEVLKINGQNTRRAKLIARDQMQKLNGVLSMARQQDIGIVGYVWRTSGDENVRDSHRDNDNMHFQWDSPPPETGHPGEDINCRCTAEPDLSKLIPGVASPGLERY